MVHTPQFTEPKFKFDEAIDEGGKLRFSPTWQRRLQAIFTTVASFTTKPTSSSSMGTPGQIAYDANFLYVCVSGNPPTWKRIALSNF